MRIFTLLMHFQARDWYYLKMFLQVFSIQIIRFYTELFNRDLMSQMQGNSIAGNIKCSFKKCLGNRPEFFNAS